MFVLSICHVSVEGNLDYNMNMFTYVALVLNYSCRNHYSTGFEMKVGERSDVAGLT